MLEGKQHSSVKSREIQVRAGAPSAASVQGHLHVPGASSLCASVSPCTGVTPALLERRVASPVLPEIKQTPGDKLHTKEQKEFLPMQLGREVLRGIAAEELGHVLSCSDQWSL